MPRIEHPDLLVGVEHFSDAGVYRVAPNLAMVQTVDFFAPVVDDPFTFGQITAANALSDVYAVGGEPKTALNIVAFPYEELGGEVLHEILRGGAERVREAGAVIVGGHSVRDTEVKYGLAVTGLVDPARMLTNTGARAGDVLLLTKPLGTGFVIAANRAGRCPARVIDTACETMLQLNRAAGESAVVAQAHGATDVTGFGLAGHALEMVRGQNLTFEIHLGRLPLLAGAAALAVEANVTGALKTNRDHVESAMTFVDGSDQSPRVPFLFDPQTSGGLLVAVPPDRVSRFITECIQRGIDEPREIGVVTPRQGDASLIVRP
ncbi:MAG: selenide, water dikinase SelD [Phycisphaerales bacterium]|nr:selenide, water dikinase SelD [Phycisphaerales bacterium]